MTKNLYLRTGGRSHFQRIAGYIRGTTRIPTRADIVSVVCG